MGESQKVGKQTTELNKGLSFGEDKPRMVFPVATPKCLMKPSQCPSPIISLSFQSPRAVGVMGMEKKGGTEVLEVRSSGGTGVNHCGEFCYFIEIVS